MEAEYVTETPVSTIENTRLLNQPLVKEGSTK
jgi:hypothetical protein